VAADLGFWLLLQGALVMPLMAQVFEKGLVNRRWITVALIVAAPSLTLAVGGAVVCCCRVLW
jgi:hypothetical protein